MRHPSLRILGLCHLVLLLLGGGLALLALSGTPAVLGLPQHLATDVGTMARGKS